MKITFLASVGLGDRSVEVGDQEDIPDRLARQFIAEGRAEKSAPADASEDPNPPKKGGRK